MKRSGYYLLLFLLVIALLSGSTLPGTAPARVASGARAAELTFAADVPAAPANYSISGRVTDGSGNPLSGVRIRAHRELTEVVLNRLSCCLLIRIRCNQSDRRRRIGYVTGSTPHAREALQILPVGDNHEVPALFIA